MADTLIDPLEGITTRTTKDQMLDRLKKTAQELASVRTKLSKQERDRLDKLQEIEARVRDKWEARSVEPVSNVIVSATNTEMIDTYEFLQEFGVDLLPVPLQRLSAGLAVLLDKPNTKEDEAEDDD